MLLTEFRDILIRLRRRTLIETGDNADDGLPAWQDRLTQTQIVLLSSYVAQMSRNPIPGKEPQGEPIPPWPEAPAPSEETTEGETAATEDSG
mgnify:CR=1 FL=1